MPSRMLSRATSSQSSTPDFLCSPVGAIALLDDDAWGLRNAAVTFFGDAREWRNIEAHDGTALVSMEFLAAIHGGVDEGRAGPLGTDVADVHVGRPQKFRPKAGANPAHLVGQPVRAHTSSD